MGNCTWPQTWTLPFSLLLLPVPPPHLPVSTPLLHPTIRRLHRDGEGSPAVLSLTPMSLPQPFPSLRPLSWVAQVRPAAPDGGVHPQLPSSGCGCWWGWARTKDWRHSLLPLRNNPGRAGVEWEPTLSKPWLCARGRGLRQPSAKLHPPFLSAIPSPAPLLFTAVLVVLFSLLS